MNRRQVAVIVLASAIAACGSPLERAANAFKEQIRLGDPAAQQTYADNKDLLESAEALPIWLDAVANADSPQVQRWAATLLGNIGDPSALPALAAAVSGTRDVRDAAIDAIGRFEPEQATEALIIVLQDGTRDAKPPALAALARMGGDAAGAVSAIETVAATSEHLVANTAISTLADIGTDGAVSALAAVATDRGLDMARRRAAIQSLQRIESEAASAALAEVSATVADEDGADELREALS